MDEASTGTILEYLREMAARISSNDAAELQNMKSDLDEYVTSITSKMPAELRDTANREFEKCRVCASNWIKVYCDSTFHEGDKDDILKEETVEFFFSMDEKVVGIQKNFFVLGMIDEILKPGEPLSEKQRAGAIAKYRIRQMAKEQDLTASFKTMSMPDTNRSVQDRLWYFGDERNFLQSSEAGLTDEEAINYLLR